SFPSIDREHSWLHAVPLSKSPPSASTQKVLLIVVSAPERSMQNWNCAMVARFCGAAQLREGPSCLCNGDTKRRAERSQDGAALQFSSSPDDSKTRLWQPMARYKFETHYKPTLGQNEGLNLVFSWEVIRIS